MKKLMLISCGILFTSGITFAQHHNSGKKAKMVAKSMQAPPEIKSSFEKNFAEVTTVKWTKTSAGHWIANFMKNDIQTIAEYDAAGKWVATRQAFDAQTLPETVSNALKLKYPAATIKDGWKIERSDVAAYYKVNIQEKEVNRSVFVNEAGIITE